MSGSFKGKLQAVEEYSRNIKHRKGFQGTDIIFRAAVFDTFNGINKEGDKLLTGLFKRLRSQKT